MRTFTERPQATAAARGPALPPRQVAIVVVPLERVRTHRNTDKRGTCRWYNYHRLPERLGGGVVTVRLHANEDYVERKFFRTDNVRQIPPGDPDFELLYRRRNDAETSTEIDGR